MRIAHVTSTFPPYYGGIGNVCFYNAVGAAQKGHTVTIYTSDITLDGSYNDPPEIMVRRLPAVFKIGNAPLLPGLLRDYGVDIIHLHWPFPFGADLLSLASQIHRIPFVLTYHNDLIGSGLRKWMYELYSSISTGTVFKEASRIITVSLDHAVACRSERLFRRHWDKVVEVPNGVDTGLFRPGLGGQNMRQQYGIAEDASVLLFVGTLDRAHHYRRVDVLVRALAQLPDAQLHLMVAGGGDQHTSYFKLVETLDIADRVHFLGSVEHHALPSVYAAADITILPSQIQESFGMILIESMACGKPVIASNLPGVRTVVNDGIDGLLVEPGNPADLAEKIQMLVSDPVWQHEMGMRGREKVEAKYSWSAVIPRLIQVYEEVVAETAPGR